MNIKIPFSVYWRTQRASTDFRIVFERTNYYIQNFILSQVYCLSVLNSFLTSGNGLVVKVAVLDIQSDAIINRCKNDVIAFRSHLLRKSGNCILNLLTKGFCIHFGVLIFSYFLQPWTVLIKRRAVYHFFSLCYLRKIQYYVKPKITGQRSN